MGRGGDRGGSWAVDLAILGLGSFVLCIEGAGNLRVSGFSVFFNSFGTLVKTGVRSVAGKLAMHHAFLVRFLAFGSFWNMLCFRPF